MNYRFLLICILFLFQMFTQNVSAQKKFELADYAKLVTLADPQFSPDGKSILLLVSKPDYVQNRFHADVYIIDLATRQKRALSLPGLSISQPRWSPDGKMISFVAKTEALSVAQIQLYSLETKQTRKLTSAVRGVLYYSWSPDGSQIAYVSQDEPENKSQIEKGFTAFEIKDNDMFLTAKPSPAHIWLVKINDGQQTRLTSGEWSLPMIIPPSPPAPALSWSPDGKAILFVKVASPYSGDGPNRSIQVLTLSDLSQRPLTTRKKLETYPLFSPDGKKISYWYKRNDDPEDINEFFVVDANGKNTKSLTYGLDRDLYRSIWFPDNNSLLVGGHDDNKTSLWRISLTGEWQKLKLGSICPNWSFWLEAGVASNGAIAFVGTDPEHPSELYYLPSYNAQPIRVTDFNQEVSAMTFGKTETIRWQTDGWAHNGIVTYPVNFQQGIRYPLVLIIHGGPFSASVEQFSRLSQVFSNEGYFVFEPNYRGSDNMGSPYRLAIMSDAGSGPGRDVMDGLKKLMVGGHIDSTKIGVSGWSYGGFMTTWLTGHYPGWAAAMAGAAVTDLSDQYNLSDYSVNRASAMSGSPWTGDNMKRYFDESPITEARNCKAPMLILANTGDPRVPITQSYKLYHALKDNGTTVKFIAWPINAHNATDPVTQMERDRYWLGWMNQYLKK